MRKIIACAALVLVAGCSAPALPAALPPAAPAPGAACRLVVGAASTGYAVFASSSGVIPAVVENYVGWFAPFSVSFAGPAEPMIQIEPRHAPLQEIADGGYDSWLRFYAGQAAAWKRPLLLGFAPEMNGPWYAWGLGHEQPEVYIAAWRHVVSVFRQAGARNVTWVWTPNAVGPGVGSPSAWWPGSAWAGIVGIDAYYNTAASSFASDIAPSVSAVRQFWHGRVMLSETAAPPQAGQAAKIRDLFAGACRERLYGLVWFDLEGNRDWVLQGSGITAFRAAAREYG